MALADLRSGVFAVFGLVCFGCAVFFLGMVFMVCLCVFVGALWRCGLFCVFGVPGGILWG